MHLRDGPGSLLLSATSSVLNLSALPTIPTSLFCVFNSAQPVFPPGTPKGAWIQRPWSRPPHHLAVLPTEPMSPPPTSGAQVCRPLSQGHS